MMREIIRNMRNSTIGLTIGGLKEGFDWEKIL